MEFEYDLSKSAGNKQKHGIDFEEAKALWGDPALIEIPARTTDEQRSLVIGMITGSLWSAVITYRGNAVRLISVRCAREEEKEIYESF